MLPATTVNSALKGRSVNLREALAELCIDLDTFDLSSLTVDQCENCNMWNSKKLIKRGLCPICSSFLE